MFISAQSAYIFKKLEKFYSLRNKKQALKTITSLKFARRRLALRDFFAQRILCIEGNFFTNVKTNKS